MVMLKGLTTKSTFSGSLLDGLRWYSNKRRLLRFTGGRLHWYKCKRCLMVSPPCDSVSHLRSSASISNRLLNNLTRDSTRASLVSAGSWSCDSNLEVRKSNITSTCIPKCQASSTTSRDVGTSERVLVLVRGTSRDQRLIRPSKKARLVFFDASLVSPRDSAGPVGLLAGFQVLAR